MNKDFWKKLKLFASVVEEANDKIKEDKEMILAVCEEQLTDNRDRKIKFRGKKIHNNQEWAYGYYVYNVLYPDSYSSHRIEPGGFKIDPDTLEQYTGFKDKNGKEIYEGDLLGEIVKIDGEDIMSAIPVLWNDEMAMFVVDLSFVKDGSYVEPLYQHYENMKIIGNVYDNPDLLTVNK
jgi:uncharacterized phage protein (TIGR01671 family)